MKKNNLELIVAQTASVFQITPEMICAKGRDRIASDARHMAMLIARDNGEYIPRIAAHFGLSMQAVHYGIASMSSQIRLYDHFRLRHTHITQLLSE